MRGRIQRKNNFATKPFLFPYFSIETLGISCFFPPFPTFQRPFHVCPPSRVSHVPTYPIPHSLPYTSYLLEYLPAPACPPTLDLPYTTKLWLPCTCPYPAGEGLRVCLPPRLADYPRPPDPADLPWTSGSHLPYTYPTHAAAPEPQIQRQAPLENSPPLIRTTLPRLLITFLLLLTL